MIPYLAAIALIAVVRKVAKDKVTAQMIKQKTEKKTNNCDVRECGNKGDVGKKIPATTSESVNEKLQKYLLDINHPVGGSKAKWFKQSLGFTQDNFKDLAKQIRFDPSKAIQTDVTKYGTKFNQIIKITGSNGKKIDVTFGWIRNNDGIVRLVTGIPTKKIGA